MGVVQAIVSFGSMMADVIDQHELRTHRRQEASSLAPSLFPARLPVAWAA